MTKIIRQLLDFVGHTPHKAAVDLRQVAGQTVDWLRPLAAKRNVALRLAAGDPAVAEIDAGQIQQVLTNLIVNAIEAMPGGGKADLTIRSQAACPPEGGARPSHDFAIEVARRGAGIAEEHLSRCSSPFSPPRRSAKGPAWACRSPTGSFEEHGGWIDVSSRPGAGKPLCRPLARGSQAVNPRILIVDDSGACAICWKRTSGCATMLLAASPQPRSAARIFCREDFAVVLTDLMMPGMDGIEFCRRLAANRPDVPVIVMTAFGSLETAIAAIRAGPTIS